MSGKCYFGLLFGLLAVSLILLGIPLKGFAFHSGSESDLAANPELVAFRNYRAGSVDPLALNPELIAYRSYRAGSVDELALNPELAVGVLGGQYRDSIPHVAKVVGVLGGPYRDSIPHVAKIDDVVSNPELTLVRSYVDLAANPELLSLQQYGTCGC